MNIFDDKPVYHNRMRRLGIYLNIIRWIVFITIAFLFFTYTASLFNRHSGEEMNYTIWGQFGFVGLLLILNIVSYKRPVLAFGIISGIIFLATIAFTVMAITLISYNTEHRSSDMPLYVVMAICWGYFITILSGLFIARKYNKLAEKISSLD